MESAEDPSEFESKICQTPDLARIEEVEYDSAEGVIEYRVFLSSSLAKRIRSNGEIASYSSIVKRIENLGASSVERIGDSEVVVEFPFEE